MRSFITRIFQVFLSTPPVKAATSPASATVVPNSISIHAAREGGDGKNGFAVTTRGISIHAAREGGDAPTNSSRARKLLFLSTPPVKAATSAVQSVSPATIYFYPRRP